MAQVDDPTYCYPKRWALSIPEHPNALPRVYLFNDERERDSWVRQNPRVRVAVGKRNAEVKAWRRSVENQKRFRTKARAPTGPSSL